MNVDHDLSSSDELTSTLSSRRAETIKIINSVDVVGIDIVAQMVEAMTIKEKNYKN
jgi:hypothetical protein